MLSLNNVEVIYDSVILVLKGVSIACAEGRITTLLGANGAGKTTTLKAVSGLLRTERGEVTKGSVELAGDRIDRLPAYEVVRRGIVQVFEGRRVFVAADGRARSTPVEVGFRSGDSAQIVSGLREGDAVITTNLLRLREDMPVEVAAAEAVR